VPGPLDVVDGAPVGRLDENLAAAARSALSVSPEACRAHALAFSWAACAAQFLENLTPQRPTGPETAVPDGGPREALPSGVRKAARKPPGT